MTDHPRSDLEPQPGLWVAPGREAEADALVESMLRDLEEPVRDPADMPRPTDRVVPPGGCAGSLAGLVVLAMICATVAACVIVPVWLITRP